MLPHSSRPSPNCVLEFLEKNQKPFSVPCSPLFFSIHNVFESIDWLLAHNVGSIKRLYQPRSLENRSWIWSGYTPDAMRHNVHCIIEGSIEEYGLFLARNQLELPHSPFLDCGVSIVFAGDIGNWTGGNGPHLSWIAVQNPERKLPKTYIMETSATHPWEFKENKVKLNEIECEVLSRSGVGSQELFGSSPMLQMVYYMLRMDLHDILPDLWRR